MAKLTLEEEATDLGEGRVSLLLLPRRRCRRSLLLPLLDETFALSDLFVLLPEDALRLRENDNDVVDAVRLLNDLEVRFGTESPCCTSQLCWRCNGFAG